MKKTNKKSKGKGKSFNKNGEPMDKKQIADMQQLLADIGSWKKEGFIIMMETYRDSEGIGSNNGVVFSHSISKEHVINFSLKGLGAHGTIVKHEEI